MKTFKLTFARIASIFMAGMLLQDLCASYGEIRTQRTDPYTIWDLVLMGFVIVCFWYLGYESKKSE